MSQRDRLIHALSGSPEVKLEDIKFFLGNSRNVTQEELCREAANALAQVSLGQAQRVNSIDSDIPLTTIDRFLQ